MKEQWPNFAMFAFVVAFIWNVHRVLNNKVNKSSKRIDSRVDKLDSRIDRTEDKVVFQDVFESFKETAEAKHEALEDMQEVLKESIKEVSQTNSKDHERLMDGIAAQTKQIGELPGLIQSTIQNTLKTNS